MREGEEREGREVEYLGEKKCAGICGLCGETPQSDGRGWGGGCYVEGAVVTCRAEIMGENGGRDSGEERKRKRRDTEEQ